MAPFPEAEDMTVKRLYVALKRSDMQLLQMGAHKLHEKCHTGYQFKLLDDLKQILSCVEEQEIPNDIKSLLTKTINDILTGEKPTIEHLSGIVSQNMPEGIEGNGMHTYEQTENKPYTLEPRSPEIYSTENITQQKENENFVQDETIQQISLQAEEQPVIFTPKETENKNETLHEEPFGNETVQTVETIKPSQTFSYNDTVEQKTVEYNQPKLIEPKETDLNNVAVFYDDKAPFTDFAKNKLYRMELDMLSLEKEAHPLDSAATVKNIVDIQTDEIGEILKMLNTIKGKVYFVTTSKSENILKTFVEYNIDFEIPSLGREPQNKKVEIIPLLGLSNIFVCPKCGQKEYFAGLHNKVLSLKCNNCSGVMYPDVCEVQNLETNSNPYYWTNATLKMAKADTWILINPPLDTNKALICEFLKTTHEVAKPKRVYILSRETTKKEYYKQAFKEARFDTIVKSDFITQDALCEDFINSEMSTIKVNT